MKFSAALATAVLSALATAQSGTPGAPGDAPTGADGEISLANLDPATEQALAKALSEANDGLPSVEQIDSMISEAKTAPTTGPDAAIPVDKPSRTMVEGEVGPDPAATATAASISSVSTAAVSTGGGGEQQQLKIASSAGSATPTTLVQPSHKESPKPVGTGTGTGTGVGGTNGLNVVTGSGAARQTVGALALAGMVAVYFL